VDVVHGHSNALIVEPTYDIRNNKSKSIVSRNETRLFSAPETLKELMNKKRALPSRQSKV
jgi:hypothetical protein